MKRNFFGEPVAQPGDTFDQLAIATMEAKGLENYPEVFQVYCHHDEDGWNANLVYEEDEMQVHDFESKEALQAWLADIPGLTFGMIEWNG